MKRVAYTRGNHQLTRGSPYTVSGTLRSAGDHWAAPPQRTRAQVIPFGEAAFLVELGGEPDLTVNARVHALAAALDTAPPPALRTLIPAYTSLLVEFDPLVVDPAVVETAIYSTVERPLAAGARPGRPRIVPTVYGGKYGPDLDAVAALVGLTPSEVVARHAGSEQTVYMLGFAPGFPYLGDLPPELSVPRLETPRERVPAGSVAIAGRQTGIYPCATPGGWRILGRTPIRLFDERRDPPAYLAPGDRVRFAPIAPSEWERHAGVAADW
jgi:KipI family sensor histidine kinase inhibitor